MIQRKNIPRGGKSTCKGPEEDTSKEGQQGWKKESGDESRKVGGGKILKGLVNHGEGFGFYSECDEKPFESFEQRSDGI